MGETSTEPGLRRHPIIADTSPGRPKVVEFGIVTAIVLTCLYLAAVPWSLLNIIPCLVYLVATLGLRHGNAWSGYGGALFALVSWAGGITSMARFGAPGASWVSVILATGLIGGVAYLFFRAGRALPANGWATSRWGWIALAILTLLGPQVFRAYVIPNGSMEDTILIGDQLLVGVLGVSAPSRGDIVVFRYPVDVGQRFVKRCMGVPGDRLKLVNKEMYLNGKKLDEPYANHKTDYIDSYRDNFPSEPNMHLFSRGQDMLAHHVVNGEVVVPPDSYFVMGDNRDSSLDSRYWGFVPGANLIGKPWIVYGSYDAPTDAVAGSATDVLGRFQHFLTRTRWRRILMQIRGHAIG